MSIVTDILEQAWNTTFRAKGGIRVNLFGIPQSNKYNQNSLYSTASQLRKNGYLNKNGKVWSITRKGKEFLKTRSKKLLKFESSFIKSSPKNLFIMFDIPESRKHERHWLRTHLLKFHYHMVQKSVWVGPSPLPKEFKDYIKEIKLDQFLKTFKLAKPYKI